MTETKQEQAENNQALVASKESTAENKTSQSNKKDKNRKKNTGTPDQTANSNKNSDKKIDTTITAEKTREEQTMTENKPKEKRSGFGLSIVAISLVIALGAGLYYHGHQQSQAVTAEISSLKNQISSLQSQQNDLTQNQSTHQQALASQAKSSKDDRDRLQILLDQQTNSLTSLQNALIELKGRRPNDWLLAEADHLIKQAGRQLWIEKDIITSTRLVETADQRIAQLNDPSLTPIRQALALDIQTLKAVERIDFDGIIIQISSLQEQIDSLPLANVLLAKEKEELAKKELSKEVMDWKENLMTSLTDFSEKFITYRKREGTVVPLLTPAQTFYIKENLKAKLAQAIKAIERENTVLFQDSLKTAKQWINDFYNTEAAETQSFIKSLDTLENTKIKVELPSQLKSLSLISDELSQRLRRDLASLGSNPDSTVITGGEQ